MPRLLRYYFFAVPLYLLALTSMLRLTAPLADAVRYTPQDGQNAVRTLDAARLTLPAEDCVTLLMHSAKPHIVKNTAQQARVKLQQTRQQAFSNIVPVSRMTSAQIVLPHSFTIPKQHYVYTLMRMLC